MSGTLDRFLSPSAVKPKTSQVYAEERCANLKCRKILKKTDTKYRLIVKGKEAVYCQPCGKHILRPQENTEENL